MKAGGIFRLSDWITTGDNAASKLGDLNCPGEIESGEGVCPVPSNGMSPMQNLAAAHTVKTAIICNICHKRLHKH